MKIFFVTITTNHKWGAFYFNARFRNMPTEQDVIKAIKLNSKLAGDEFKELYELWLSAARQMLWPTSLGRAVKLGRLSGDHLHEQYPLHDDRVKASIAYITIEIEDVIDN